MDRQCGRRRRDVKIHYVKKMDIDFTLSQKKGERKANAQ